VEILGDRWARRPVAGAPAVGRSSAAILAAPGRPASGLLVLTLTGYGRVRTAVRHEGLVKQLECYDQCSAGWDHYLASLRDHIESGTGSPVPGSDDPPDMAART
jgi:hypothetical protein